MTNVFLIILLLLFPAQGFAKITKENVTNALLQEFYSKKQKDKDVMHFENKDADGMHVESMTFVLGEQVYKLVFFGDGKLELSMGQRGDIAMQEILSSTVEKTTPTQIIRLIQGFQKATPTSGEVQKEKNGQTDAEKISTGTSASLALQWSKLIDRAASGQSMRVSSGQDQGFSESVSAARMMNQCQGSQNAGSPQRNAAQNIAEAMVLSNFQHMKDEGFLDKSKEYEKRGEYSFFDEVDQFNHASPERAYQLMKKVRTTEYEIFQSSLQKSNIESRDPYYLAANRNFMFLVRTIGKDSTLKLMDEGMKKIALNVERFVEYRKILPASSVVYDRRKDKYYIDPTLNQPSQARYLLSLVCMYEWKNQDKKFQKKLEELKTSVDDKKIKEIFSQYDEFLKNTSHPRFQ